MSQTKLCVTLTPSYRLTSDGERNYSIEQRVTVDPAKSPNFLAKLKADPTAVAPAAYEDWRELDAHYPMTASGLAAALNYVINRQAAADGAAMGVLGLAAFARIISGHAERIEAAVTGVMKGDR